LEITIWIQLEIVQLFGPDFLVLKFSLDLSLILMQSNNPIKKENDSQSRHKLSRSRNKRPPSQRKTTMTSGKNGLDLKNLNHQREKSQPPEGKISTTRGKKSQPPEEKISATSLRKLRLGKCYRI